VRAVEQGWNAGNRSTGAQFFYMSSIAWRFPVNSLIRGILLDNTTTQLFADCLSQGLGRVRSGGLSQPPSASAAQVPTTSRCSEGCVANRKEALRLPRM